MWSSAVKWWHWVSWGRQQSVSYYVYTGLRELRFVWLYEGYGLLLCWETHELRNGISAVSCLSSTELSHPSSDKRLDVWTQSHPRKSLLSHTDPGTKMMHDPLQSTYKLIYTCIISVHVCMMTLCSSCSFVSSGSQWENPGNPRKN